MTSHQAAGLAVFLLGGLLFMLAASLLSIPH
jgi:hypothetical protein